MTVIFPKFSAHFNTLDGDKVPLKKKNTVDLAQMTFCCAFHNQTCVLLPWCEVEWEGMIICIGDDLCAYLSYHL